MIQQFKDAVDDLGGHAVVKIIMCSQFEAIKDSTAISLLQSIYSPHRAEEESISRLAKSSEYRKLLTKALSVQNYDELEAYVHKALSSTMTPQDDDQVQPVEEHSLAKAFASKYKPGAESALYDFLRRCNSQFGSRHYGKFCSIVQSSGTGKSRTLVETAQLRRKNVVVVYMNVREPKEKNSYPPRDHLPGEILASKQDDSADDYTDRCVAFFTALFKTLASSLTKLSKLCDNREQVIASWSEGMCTLDSYERVQFFGDVKRAYDEALTRIRKKHDKLEELLAETKLQDKAPTDQIYVAPKRKTPSTSNEEKPTGAEANGVARAGNKLPNPRNPGSPTDQELQLAGEVTMATAYRKMFHLEPPVLLKGTDDPQLVIVIDEAHTLCQPHNEYLPSHILCQVISAFSISQRTSAWVVFASTASRVADFSAPAYIHPSLRINQGGSLLFRPYSALDWDQRAHPPGSVDPQDVARFENIVRLGRPLWQSLVESGLDPARILDTAGQKICNEQTYEKTPEQALALLGQRFILDVCFGRYRSNQFVENAVSSHMRVCLGTTEDRAWKRTSYPSEPLLSCAVARVLHARPNPWSGWTGGIMETELVHLNAAIVEELVDKGQKGELISRLIYLLGKDLLVRQSGFAEADSMDSELPDCKAIPATTYLEFMFGKDCLDSDMMDLLNGWHINFSRWVAMEKPIAFRAPDSEGPEGMGKWLMRHWARTSAIQCCHNQHSFDKVIPMYNTSTGSFSFILISDKAKAQHSEDELSRVSPESGKLPSAKQPYIAILADLGIGARQVKIWIDKATESKAVRIYAPGIGDKPYSFLKELPVVASYLHGLVALPNTSDKRQTDNEKRVADRMEFGSTCEDKHMDW